MASLKNAPSSALAPETQRAPSYAPQHQSVVGYTPKGILGTLLAPRQGDDNGGISFNTVPGQPTGDPNLAVQLPFGSRVTQIVAEAVFPADDGSGQIDLSGFNIGSGRYNQNPMKPAEFPKYQNGDLFLDSTLGGAYKTSRVFRNMGDIQSNNNITPPGVGQGSVGYIRQSPDPEINFVNLGEGTSQAGGGQSGLQNSLLLGAEFKVIISYVVIADNAESYLAQAINQARPSVRGA